MSFPWQWYIHQRKSIYTVEWRSVVVGVVVVVMRELVDEVVVVVAAHYYYGLRYEYADRGMIMCRSP